MSSFNVLGVTYTSAMLNSYLGRVPTSNRALQEAFREYGIKPTGSTSDLKRLKNAMYQDYSAQVKDQIKNQEEKQSVAPWEGIFAQIGLKATGDLEKDRLAFDNAINLLSQSAMDGPAMTYFAGLRSEARAIFSSYDAPDQQKPISFYTFESRQLS